MAHTRESLKNTRITSTDWRGVAVFGEKWFNGGTCRRESVAFTNMTKGIKQQTNIAFVDGQNLHMSTTTAAKPWHIDLARFRVYLNQKYKVEKAYYFLGFTREEYQEIYSEIQEAGFILQFREHSSAMLGKKKGNVDTDIVFAIMKKLYRNETFDKIVLVSGDGDYKMLVDFLIEESRLKKILFPDQKRASSLYKKIDLRYRADLNTESIIKKIGEQKEKGSLGN